MMDLYMTQGLRTTNDYTDHQPIKKRATLLVLYLYVYQTEMGFVSETDVLRLMTKCCSSWFLVEDSDDDNDDDVDELIQYICDDLCYESYYIQDSLAAKIIQTTPERSTVLSSL